MNTLEKITEDLAFLNIDTQNDFIEPTGSLSIPCAEKIRKNLGKLTKLARKKGIPIISTADLHTLQDSEISNEPDEIYTFKPHCMIGTEGAEFIPETKPRNPYIINYNDSTFNLNQLLDSREIVLCKNDFEVFNGNPHAKDVFEFLNPKRLVVYGVASNICVNQAIQRLFEILPDTKIYVPMDAVKEFYSEKKTFAEKASLLAALYRQWQEHGVQVTTKQEIYQLTGIPETCFEI